MSRVIGNRRYRPPVRLVRRKKQGVPVLDITGEPVTDERTMGISYIFEQLVEKGVKMPFVFRLSGSIGDSIAQKIADFHGKHGNQLSENP